MADTSDSTDKDVVQQSNDDSKYDRSLSDEFLLMIIDIDNGLLDQLYSDYVLSDCQRERFGPSSLSNQTDRITELLKEITKLSLELKEKFLSALEKTKQSHVANYIRNDGQRPTTDPDNWPIDQKTVNTRIRQKWKELCEIIDSQNGLLDVLLSAGCISMRQKEWIEVEKENDKRNDRLIRTIRRASVRDYNKFIRCLEKTKQHHVASLFDLNPISDSESECLTEQQKSSIETNFSDLVDLITCEDGFIAKLFSKTCITKQQMEFIEAAPLSAESNRRLLRIILRGSQKDFRLFVECLAETGQEHVSSLLSGDGVVISVVAKTTGFDKLTLDEKHVTKMFMEMLSMIPSQNRKQITAELMTKCEQLRDAELIAMKPGNSVKLFFVCNSLTGLFQLNELFISGQLRNIIQHLFNELLGNKELIKIDSLVWKSSDYNAAAHHLLNKHGLPVHSLIYQLALHSSQVTTEPLTGLRSFQTVLQRPHELVELVIMKSIAQLFVAMRNSAPRVDVITMTTFSSVSQYWWLTMSSLLKRNKNSLRLYLKRMCAPYKFNPVPIATLQIPRCNNMSLAELHDKVYVVGAKSSTVYVSKVPQSSCDTLEEINIPQLREPADIVSCSMNNSLYISDAKSHCIWRVNIFASESHEENTVKNFISTDYKPWTLSLRSRQLLVTSYGGSVLYIYGSSDGELVRQIKLPTYMLARHAVLAGDDSVIVCPTHNWSIDASESEENEQIVSISKVSGQGQVLLACNGDDLEHVRPNYLTTDDSDHLLICDPDNRQIIHLNSNLQMEQILVAQLIGVPRRLCYSQQSGFLYICYYAISEITVYDVTARN